MASRPMVRESGQPFSCVCPCATWTAQGGWDTSYTYPVGEITPEGDNCDEVCPDCPDPYSIAPSGVDGGGKPVLTAPSIKGRR